MSAPHADGGTREILKQLDVRFADGHAVLNAYWGYLSGGGLVLAGDGAVDVGDQVALRVQVSSIGSEYRLAARVVRCDQPSRVIVAFHPGEPHDLLITDALHETEHVPARQDQRYVVDVQGKLAGEPVLIVNLSRSGCRVRGAGEATAPVGARVEVDCGGHAIPATVVWASGADRGLRFEESLPEAVLSELRAAPSLVA